MQLLLFHLHLHTYYIYITYSFQMLAKWCSKFSKLGFNSMWAKNFRIFKLDLEKAEEPYANIHWIIEKAREF